MAKEKERFCPAKAAGSWTTLRGGKCELVLGLVKEDVESYLICSHPPTTTPWCRFDYRPAEETEAQRASNNTIASNYVAGIQNPGGVTPSQHDPNLSCHFRAGQTTFQRTLFVAAQQK